MFKSARIKLTLFYLAILLVFSLTLTLGTRMLAEREFDSSNFAQRNVVHRLFLRLYSIPPNPDSSFTDEQKTQTTRVRQQLNDDVIFINLAALVIGGILSYWYAGQALQPIEEAHKAQQRFASDASHELRTPLANMRLENEVFLRQKKFAESEAKKLIQSNLEEVQRLESLANNLLSLTQYGHASLPLAPVAIEGVFAQAQNQVAKFATTRQVKFDCKLAAAQVIGNTDSLEQLLVIVLDNAIKYGPKSGTIFIHGKRDDGHYRLTVRDEGDGIAPEDLPHIFERLYRGDKARTGGSGGYGLGLALAAEIARGNHASLSAANVPRSGAIFTLRIPVVK